MESRHLGTYIERPLPAVYDYASDAAHLPEWASGLGDTIELIDGRWVVESPMGRLEVAFAPRNEFGVLDHQVTTASGETFDNPMRVIAARTGCEVVFSLRRQAGMSDAEFERDTDTVSNDLIRLKQIMERT